MVPLRGSKGDKGSDLISGTTPFTDQEEKLQSFIKCYSPVVDGINRRAIQVQNLNIGKQRHLHERIHEIKSVFFSTVLGGNTSVGYNLEGLSMSLGIYSTLEDLKEYKKTCPESDIPYMDNIISLFGEAYAFAKVRDVIDLGSQAFKKDKKDLTEAYRNRIMKRIEGLQPGQSFLLPVGRDAHAWILEFQTRVEGGKVVLDFKMYNSGEGSEHQETRGLLYGLNSLSRARTFEIRNIDLKDVDILDVIKEVTALKPNEHWYDKIPLVSGIASEIRSMYGKRKIYRKLKEIFIEKGHGVLVRGGVSSEFHKAQKTGICARKAYTLWLREHLSLKQYQEFKVFASESAIRRMEEVRKFEDDLFGPKKELKSIFAKTIMRIKRYWQLNFLSDDETAEELIELGQKVLKKRKAKIPLTTSRQRNP